MDVHVMDVHVMGAHVMGAQQVITQTSKAEFQKKIQGLKGILSTMHHIGAVNIRKMFCKFNIGWVGLNRKWLGSP